MKRTLLLLLALAALLAVPDCASQDPSAEQGVTRAAFAATALDCYYAIGGTAPEDGATSFPDCDDPAVTAAVGLGLVSGFPDGTFRPEEPITRQQAAVILARAMDAAGVEISGLCGTTFASLSDGDRVASWARNQVSTLVNMDVLRDLISNDTLRPTSGLTQEEADALTARFRSVVHSLTPSGGESFGGQLTAQLSQEKNLVLSPLSVQMALGLLEPGAAGETLSQLSSLLAGTDLSSWQQILTQETENGPTVEIANSLWLDTSVTPKESYLSALKTAYDAESQTLDLDTGAAMTAINNWVKEKTHGLIDRLLNQPLSPDASAVLVNALYFKGEWAHTFAPDDTHDAVFHTETGDVTVPFMNDLRYGLGCIDTDTCYGTALPYKGDGNWWLLCLLPKEGVSPADLAGEDLNALFESRENQAVRLSLPKFTLEGSYDLTAALYAMGLTDAFDQVTADFSNLGTSEIGNLYLSQIIHKTYLRVDEEGTEAAAVTAAMVEAASAFAEEPITLTFDRPFLCCLWNADIGQPLFLAVVDDPS